MARRLPPLNALRAFDAAARHLSFTRAADELNVTQAAVSHQIRSLEEHFGVALFTRLSRSLQLTPEGERYFPGVRSAFDTLLQATDALLESDSRGRLTVSMMPSFAARWFVPRMGRFQAQYPDIDLLIATSRELTDFDRESVDVVVRYTSRTFPDLHCVRLMSDEIFPVCAPSIVCEQRPLAAPADLRHHTLLHDETEYDWETWLSLSSVEGVDANRGPVFIDASMLIQAAVDGLGVALTRRVLVEDELAAGRLVRPFEQTLPDEHRYAYYIVCPKSTATQPKIAAFTRWMLEESQSARAREQLTQ
ncbi:MAG: transcriptional regulator GcvA [Gammaproteobacteria bacterium]|nr:transcriptional regulator GcvA [Gammaproteobacteria bacterium]